uniref:Uncharacterized protein n=1 Tax=Leptobrachium leishanense TaxID=445787 RepID=A0A8C5PJH6_9ANUR
MCPHPLCLVTWNNLHLFLGKEKISFSLLVTTMASAGLRDEMTCCICMDLYTDPVALPCGHSFCLVCIGRALDTKERSDAYKCPECRAQFEERPALEKNRKLCNIVETFLSTPPEQEEVGIFCTYCIQSPVPAVKTCLLCEASLCENHLSVHSKSADHVLTKPTASLGNKKCHIHKKVLEYYCCEDAACICVSCSLAGVHRGHQVENLIEAAEKEKEKLRNILEKVTSEREKAANQIQNLQELSKEVLEKAASVSKDVTTMIKDIREQLEVLEDCVLSEISMQAEQVSLQVSRVIQQLEIKKEELSKKMDHIKELCGMTDPLTVLQGRKSARAEEGDKEDTVRHDIKDLDVGLISATLHFGLDKIWTSIERQCNVPAELLLDVNMVSDMLMDVDTASNKAIVSDDLKTLYWTSKNQRRPDTSLRFRYPQVLSTRPFSSGRHYWDVEPLAHLFESGFFRFLSSWITRLRLRKEKISSVVFCFFVVFKKEV